MLTSQTYTAKVEIVDSDRISLDPKHTKNRPHYEMVIIDVFLLGKNFKYLTI
ncbi:hypothetical protein [Nostoc sp. C052]|uniref:hypothetical protein n=1 Tax=Nostoc sp. C052 TaxID=2576902 RepID=UPI0015C3C029|nr:hypothetical protein [Nostoc sp. C052]